MKSFQNIISIIFLAAFALALIQCSKDDLNTNIKNITQIQTRTTVDPDCLPTQGQNCTQANDTLEVSVGLFSGCTFKIVFRVQRCHNTNNDWTYNIGDFQLIDHNCPAFDQTVTSLNNGELESFLFTFKSQVRDAVISYYLNHEQQIEGKRITFANYYASCMMACFVKIGKGGKGDPTKAIIFYSLNCGDACCKLEVIHQFLNGNWVLISRRTISPGGICNPAGNVCLPGSFKSTNCFAQCNDSNS
jgi:hypothetical protein